MNRFGQHAVALGAVCMLLITVVAFVVFGLLHENSYNAMFLIAVCLWLAMWGFLIYALVTSVLVIVVRTKTPRAIHAGTLLSLLGIVVLWFFAGQAPKFFNTLLAPMRIDSVQRCVMVHDAALDWRPDDATLKLTLSVSDAEQRPTEFHFYFEPGGPEMALGGFGGKKQLVPTTTGKATYEFHFVPVAKKRPRAISWYMECADGHLTWQTWGEPFDDWSPRGDKVHVRRIFAMPP